MECAIRRRKGIIKPIKVNKGVMMLNENEKEEPLSPTSAAFHKPNFNIHIIAIMGCKTPIDVEFCKAKAPFTLLKHPRFSSLVVGDPSKGEELKWVRTEVDLDKHVIVPNIDHENIESPNKFVEDYIYNLSKTTLTKSRPLWDIHVLHLKLSEDVKSLAIFRIHHSLGDGTSLISLLLALMRKTSDPEALPTIPAQKMSDDDDDDDNNNNKREGLVWRWILTLWWILLLSWNTFVDVLLFAATALFLKDNSPLKNKSPGKAVINPRRIVYKIFSLDDMKLVKNAVGGTINDVALGITQAGLSRYLSRKYGIDGSHGRGRNISKKFKKHIRLRSVLLINIRPTGGIQDLADMMEKDTAVKWGNSLGYVLLPFTIGLRDDPLDYIREAKATVDRKKHSLEAFYTFFIAEVVMKLFGTKIASAITDRINAHTTIAFSNLVGPLEEIGFYGHPMAFLAPSSYGQPHEVMINFQSYTNKMTLVLAVDEEVVEDPHQLCDDIVESLKTVKDAVISQGLVKDFVAPNQEGFPLDGTQ